MVGPALVRGRQGDGFKFPATADDRVVPADGFLPGCISTSVAFEIQRETTAVQLDHLELAPRYDRLEQNGSSPDEAGVAGAQEDRADVVIAGEGLGNPAGPGIARVPLDPFRNVADRHGTVVVIEYIETTQLLVGDGLRFHGLRSAATRRIKWGHVVLPLPAILSCPEVSRHRKEGLDLPEWQFS